MSTSMNRKRARQQGITMVEALVALVVLSVGMLGIASLYVASLQAGRTALLRTQAVNLVNDMMDRIRANTLGREDYALASYAGGPKVQTDCVASKDDLNCSTEKLAEDDLARWIASTEDLLPGATQDLTYTKGAIKTAPDTYVVTVKWREPGMPDDGSADLSYISTLSIIPVEP